jgi:hypothetical protein
VVFISSDGVLFNLHRRNLEITTGAFPPAEFTTADDVVPLTEPSAVLELLFQFAYPQQYPDIFLIKPFELFAALAEAAEKYQVYPAINACQMQMRLVAAKLHRYTFIKSPKVHIHPSQIARPQRSCPGPGLCLQTWTYGSCGYRSSIDGRPRSGSRRRPPLTRCHPAICWSPIHVACLSPKADGISLPAQVCRSME